MSYLLVGATILIQLMLSGTETRRMIFTRACVGAVSSFVALYFLYETTVDFVLFVGVCLYRYAEIGTDARHVRKYYLYGSAFYAVHALMMGNYFAFYMDILIVLSGQVNFEWVKHKVGIKPYLETK